MGVLLWPQTRQEQILDQRYRRAQSEPVGAGVSGQSKPQTLPVTDEEINRIWYADDPRYQRSQKIREMQEPKSLEALLLDGYWYDDDPDYQALVQAGKLKTVQDLVEELKAREQAEKARDVSTQSARAEQRAAREYQEQREREQNAHDLSTQAALDEKLAAKKRIAIQPIKEYDENVWDWFIGLAKERIRNDPVSLPYQSTYDSLSEKPIDYITPFAEWIADIPNHYSPHHDIWNSLEDTPNAYEAIKDYYSSAKKYPRLNFSLWLIPRLK